MKISGINVVFKVYVSNRISSAGEVSTNVFVDAEQGFNITVSNSGGS